MSRERISRSGGALTPLSLRGNRHAPDMWNRLLPGAKAKLVEAGLFTPEGTITEAGQQALKDMD